MTEKQLDRKTECWTKIKPERLEMERLTNRQMWEDAETKAKQATSQASEQKRKEKGQENMERRHTAKRKGDRMMERYGVKNKIGRRTD